MQSNAPKTESAANSNILLIRPRFFMDGQPTDPPTLERRSSTSSSSPVIFLIIFVGFGGFGFSNQILRPGTRPSNLVEMADRLESNFRDGILPIETWSILPGPEVVLWGGGLITGGIVIVSVLVVLVVVAPLVMGVNVGVGALVVLGVVTFAVWVEVGVYSDELVSWPPPL